MKRALTGLAAAAALLLTTGITVHGSSHREAPGITKMPKLDGTDFYMFRSYEPGRSDYITLLANYVPLQDVYGGPNFFALDTDGLYEIHIDNDGDGREDITFQFQFTDTVKNLTVPVGDKNIAVPLVNIGPIGPKPTDTGNLNVVETYTLNIVRGDRRHGHREAIVNADTGSAVFRKPADRIGDKSIRNNDRTAYGDYANQHIYPINIPGCAAGGRVFVGQRRDGFVVNLAEAFDLINLNPLGPVDGELNSLADKNVTTLALEVPTTCLVANDPVIGGWTTASSGKADGKGDADDKKAWEPGDFTQVSRLGSPLVNELVIGLKDKDKFNASQPKDDAYFADYVTHPTLPVLIDALFSVGAPASPRADLVAVFLTGVAGLNKPADVKPSEMLRLNTTTPIVPVATQNSLGVIGGDAAGFPNGRRPGDDVVDIALRAVEGILLSGDPAHFPAFTDGAYVDARVSYLPDGHIAVTAADKAAFPLFRSTFPYLQTPISGSPSPEHQ
jgi:hypothetical protein